MMKMSKIKKVCVKRESIQMITPLIPENMVQQWVGASSCVFFPIAKTQMTPAELGQFWDITADKVQAYVNDKPDEQLAPALSRVPVMASADKPMDLYDFGDIYVLHDTRNNKTYMVSAADVEPCMGNEMPAFVPLPDFEFFADWLGVYVDGKLCEVVKCVDEPVKRRIYTIMNKLSTVDGLVS